MSEFSSELIGNLHAKNYDALFDDIDDNQRGGALLHELAAGGDALEFGVGTGRLAIPLSELGTHVYGVDISQNMLDLLHDKVSAERVTPLLANFVDARIDKPVSLVYCVFSTLFMLKDQEEQVQTFINAARHLPPGGRLLTDMFVHDRTRFTNNQETVTLAVDVETADFRVALLEPNNQLVRTQRVMMKAGKVEMIPNRLRFIYPAELDLMARIAGLEPEAKWSDWARSPFTATSTNLTAVFRKPG